MHAVESVRNTSISTCINSTYHSLYFSELEHRIDFQLHHGAMENAYISAVTSHTSYWSSQDVALFILQQLHPDDAS